MMPFFSPFKESFTKKDLLYGLNQWRDIYIQTYPAFKAVNDSRDYIDSYNITPYEMIDTCQSVKAKRRRHFIKTIKADPKNSMAYKTQPFRFRLTERNARIENPMAVLRKTKAGLSWAAQCVNTNNEFHIHFILDGIKMPEAIFKGHEIDKNYRSFRNFLADIVNRNKDLQFRNLATLDYSLSYDNSIIKNRAMTGAELRWIYRNRFNEDVQNSIQFWYAGKPCSPPWEKEFDQVVNSRLSHLWQLYKPKCMQKLN